LDELLQLNKTGAFMKTKTQNNDLSGSAPLNAQGLFTDLAGDSELDGDMYPNDKQRSENRVDAITHG